MTTKLMIKSTEIMAWSNAEINNFKKSSRLRKD